VYACPGRVKNHRSLMVTKQREDNTTMETGKKKGQCENRKGTKFLMTET